MFNKMFSSRQKDYPDIVCIDGKEISIKAQKVGCIAKQLNKISKIQGAQNERHEEERESDVKGKGVYGLVTLLGLTPKFDGIYEDYFSLGSRRLPSGFYLPRKEEEKKNWDEAIGIL